MKNESKWERSIERLSSIVAKTPLVKEKKWGADVYTHHGKNVLSFHGFKHYVALWFFNGVFLKDPLNVLINAQEGKTKALRQWRFTSADEIREQDVLAYIREAILNEEAGKVWKPQSTELPSIPPILDSALREDVALQSAFESLPPYKRKDYIEYIAQAKREATKVTRLEKIRPMILEGKGLNDQYAGK